MELTWEQEKYLDVLKVGHVIIKVKGRIDKPVMVYFPKHETPPGQKENAGGEVFLGSEKRRIRKDNGSPIYPARSIPEQHSIRIWASSDALILKTNAIYVSTIGIC
jgi:hypothetical protein